MYVGWLKVTGMVATRRANTQIIGRQRIVEKVLFCSKEQHLTEYMHESRGAWSSSSHSLWMCFVDVED